MKSYLFFPNVSGKQDVSWNAYVCPSKYMVGFSE